MNLVDSITVSPAFLKNNPNANNLYEKLAPFEYIRLDSYLKVEFACREISHPAPRSYSIN